MAEQTLKLGSARLTCERQGLKLTESLSKIDSDEDMWNALEKHYLDWNLMT